MPVNLENEFSRWIARTGSGKVMDEEVAELANWLAASGDRLYPQGTAADLASTGGPGSLSTLWAPAVLAANGLLVPKLGVPGRPAGGIDVLSQVPGYRIDLDVNGAKAVLEKCGYVHLIAGGFFAPADGAMFAYRQRTNAQAIPALAIASLLAKKIVTGVTSVGLEVRVAPHGNFGVTHKQARLNAQQFVRVAKHLGMKAVCFLTDGTVPQQPYLGRGEALLAMSVLFGSKACNWLETHALACEGWASVISHLPPPSRLGIAYAFASNIIAQGGSIDGMQDRATKISAGHRRIVVATQEGVVSYDLGRVREAILQARKSDDGILFDDSAGVILLAKPGSVVRKGEPIISVRCSDSVWPVLSDDVLRAIGLANLTEDNVLGSISGSLEVIRDGDR